MAKKGGCGGCLIKTLITLVLVAVILFTAGWFGGNALMKKYIGDNGEYRALGINDWGDLGAFFRVFDGAAPATAAGDRVSDANRARTEEYLAGRGVALGKTPDGAADYTGLFDGSVAVAAEIALDGGMIAVILDGCLAEITSFAEYGARVEAAAVAVGDAGEGSLSVVMSLSKAALLDRLGVKGFARTMVNLLLRGDTVYLKLDVPLAASDGRLQPIAAEAATQPALGVNDLNEADSARIVATIAAAVQPETPDTFVRDLANRILEQFNRAETANGAAISLARDYPFGAYSADAIVLGRPADV